MSVKQSKKKKKQAIKLDEKQNLHCRQANYSEDSKREQWTVRLSILSGYLLGQKIDKGLACHPQLFY